MDILNRARLSSNINNSIYLNVNEMCSAPTVLLKIFLKHLTLQRIKLNFIFKHLTLKRRERVRTTIIRTSKVKKLKRIRMSKVSIKIKDFWQSNIIYGVRFDHFVESQILVRKYFRWSDPTYGIRFDHFVESQISVLKISSKVQFFSSKIYQRTTTTYGILPMDTKACGG